MTRAFVPFVLLAALGGCTGFFFHPDRIEHLRPESFGIGAYERVSFPSLPGGRMLGGAPQLSGLFFPSKVRPALGTVVHFHGNAGNVTGHFGYASWLAEEGFNVLAFDYRGYGASEGRPSEDGLVDDGVAALRYVRGRPDVDPSRIIIFGQSLGAAVAVVAAAQAQHDGLRAIVLEGGFSSYRSIARAKLRIPWFTRLLAWPLSFLVSDSQSPVAAAKGLPACPILVLHEEDDPVVPYSEGRRLFAALSEPKTFWTVPGSLHAGAFLVTGPGREYRPKLIEFLRKALTGA